MMTVLEYAEDVDKTAEEILRLCKELEIPAEKEEDLLDAEHITLLDIKLGDHEIDEIEEVEDDEVESKVEPIQTKKDKPVIKKEVKSKQQTKDKKKLAKDKKEMYKSKEKLTSNTQEVNDDTIIYKEDMTIKELAEQLKIASSEIIKKLFLLGIMANINTFIDYEQSELIASEYNKKIKKQEAVDIANFEEFEIEEEEKDLVKKPPVVTIMGHVDHGKTTLLDYIRSSKMASGEAGGITQTISAYQVPYKDSKITFIDTPGHAAFTEMRARGAKITDIIIIIVAADDGIKAQTKEVIDHAKAAGNPIIIAINKIDKPDINIEKVMTELAEYGLMSEEWGGETLYNNISAITGEGIDELLDNILLLSELNDYKANPTRYASGTVIEATLDKKMGNTATVLVQSGTLRIGDPIVVGLQYGKVRTMKNDMGKEIVEALPGTPIEITGLSGTPEAGDRFMAFETEKEAKKIYEERKVKSLSKKKVAAVSLEELFSKMNAGFKELNIIIKADLNGSAEALKNSLEKLDVSGIKINIIRSSVGAITDSDINLAEASKAIIIGFNVRPNATIRKNAEDKNIEVRLYNIIYKVVEDMELALKGMLEPEYEEKILGTAEVRQIFKFSKVGIIAGSYVQDGIIKANAKARIMRDGIVIYDGDINTIQREKDQVKEVKKGFECGITIEKYDNLEEGDIIEAYEMVEIIRD